MYCISIRGQPTRGGSFSWRLGKVLTTRHKTGLVTTRIHVPRAWTDYLVHPKVMQKQREIWYIECKDPVQVRVSYHRSQGISEI